MKKIFYIIVINLLWIISINAQDQGFILQNGSKYERKGIQIEDGNNPYKRVKIKNTEGIFFIYPNEIGAYSDGKGNYFETFEISRNGLKENYFLKLISKEEFGKLYFLIDEDYNKRIFLYHDGLVELLNNELENDYYKNKLHKLGDCLNKEEIIQQTNFSSLSISRTLKSLNTCKSIFNPKPALSVFFEYVNFSLKPKIHINDPLIIPTMFLTNENASITSESYSMSIGYSIPINKSKLSFDQLVSYNYFNSSRLNNFSNISYRFFYTVKSLEYSPMIRIRSTRDTWQTSFSIGPTIGIPNNNEISLFSSKVDPQTLDFIRRAQTIENIGLQIGYRMRIHFETRIKYKFITGIFLSGGQLFQTPQNNSKFNITRYSLGLTFGVLL